MKQQAVGCSHVNLGPFRCEPGVRNREVFLAVFFLGPPRPAYGGFSSHGGSKTLSSPDHATSNNDSATKNDKEMITLISDHSNWSLLMTDIVSNIKQPTSPFRWIMVSPI